MSTITVKERTKKAIEQEARRRGLSVPDYVELAVDRLRLVESADQEREDELRRRLKARLQRVASITPQPNKPRGLGGDFAEAMFREYRGNP